MLNVAWRHDLGARRFQGAPQLVTIRMAWVLPRPPLQRIEAHSLTAVRRGAKTGGGPDTVPCALPPRLPYTLRSRGGAAVPRCAFRWEECAVCLQIRSRRLRERGLAVRACKGLGVWAGQGQCSHRRWRWRSAAPPSRGTVGSGGRPRRTTCPKSSPTRTIANPSNPSNLGGEVSRDG